MMIFKRQIDMLEIVFKFKNSLYSSNSEGQNCWPDFRDAQAGPRLFCFHTGKSDCMVKDIDNDPLL